MLDADRLISALRRLRTVTGFLAEEADMEPAECVVVVSAKGPDGSRELARVSLADCFAEVDDLLRRVDAPCAP